MSFRSGTERCAAWLYRAPGASARTCVVMAHGFAATRYFGLERFARKFQAHGIDVLLFDYRHFGDSGGTPRGLLDVPSQHEDWAAAIAFARGLGYDNIVLWGTSFAGGHVLHLAAHDSEIAAVISQVPHIDGPASALAAPWRSALGLTAAALADSVLSWFGRRVYVRAFGPEGSFACLCRPGAWDAVLKMLPTDTAGKDGMSWREYLDANNRVTAGSLLQLMRYSPGRTANRIRCPVLIQAGRRDRTTPFEPARRCSERVVSCRFLAYDVDHFDVYLGECFERTIRDQLQFLEDTLPR